MLKTLTALSFALTLGNPCSGNPTVFLSMGKDQKIQVYSLDESSGTLTLKSETKTDGSAGPIGVSPDRKTLYVALRPAGDIAAFRIHGQKLQLLGTSPVGAGACYLNVHPSGKYLLSAYFQAGKVAVHGIDQDGSVSDAPLQMIETDERAHAMVLDRSGKFAFVPHTRPNSVFQFHFDSESGKLILNNPEMIQREQNSGPRHLWFHPDQPFAFGSDEQGMSATVYAFNSERGTLKPIQTISSVPTGDFDGKRSTSDIEVHPSGKFVFIANRGYDFITSFTVDETTGKLTLLERTPTEAVTRSFNISPDGRFLVAAGQTSGKLATFSIAKDGTLKRLSTTDAGINPWWVQIIDAP